MSKEMADKKSSDNTMISREMHEKEVQVHKDNAWNYIQAYARSCDYIGEAFGDEALRQFHVEIGKKRARPALEIAAEKGVEKFMKVLYRQMDSLPDGDFGLKETDEEIVVSGRCGSGGRWIREGLTARNQAGVPYYCVHCSIWWEEMPKEFDLKMTFHRSEDGNNCAWKLQK